MLGRPDFSGPKGETDMARLDHTTDPTSAGFLALGEQMLACRGAAPAGGRGLRLWRRLARLWRAPRRHDDAAGLADRQRKDIGLPPLVPMLSADAATRLAIRARR